MHNAMYPELAAPSEHPANIGLNFHFDENGISEEVLRNYLSRAQNCNIFCENCAHLEEDIKMLFTTGAKMWSRAYTPWIMNAAEFKLHPIMKETIEKVHSVDPDIVFENCIFESLFPSVEEIPIPAYVFEAFGQKPEQRNFSLSAMIFPDGRFANLWGPNTGVPDITQLETQMWFYYRGCLFVDLGFESIHFGQIMLMAKDDVGFVIFDRIIKMIRDYARDHARRGWVLFNAHMYDDRVGGTDRLICDFHMSPTRGLPPVGSVPHDPAPGNPQEIELIVGHFDSIYLDSPGGITPSGWRTSSLPYIVELDNACTYEKEWLDTPCWPKQTEWYKGGWWSHDEISWFSVQPDDYRRYWLRHSYHWVKNIDGHGYCQMPGHRGGAVRTDDPEEPVKPKLYLAHERGDVETMRDIFIEDRLSRG